MGALLLETIVEWIQRIRVFRDNTSLWRGWSEAQQEAGLGDDCTLAHRLWVEAGGSVVCELVWITFPAIRGLKSIQSSAKGRWEALRPCNFNEQTSSVQSSARQQQELSILHSTCTCLQHICRDLSQHQLQTITKYQIVNRQSRRSMLRPLHSPLMTLSFKD